jgi:hypothetical protein
MKIIRRMLLVLMLLPTLALAAMSGRPLEEPAPIAVPAGLSNASIVKAVTAAGVGRGWAVSEAGPGQLTAKLVVRLHVLEVLISYSATQVSIQYQSSSELGYEERDGQRYIHPKYGNWTRNLAMDIGVQLNLAAVQ